VLLHARTFGLIQAALDGKGRVRMSTQYERNLATRFEIRLLKVLLVKRTSKLGRIIEE